MNDTNDILIHYGVGADDNPPGRGSGRYPKGSGDVPYQHVKDFGTRLAKLRSEGKTDKQIAEELGTTVVRLKAQERYLKHVERMELAAQARQLRDEGKSLKQIANIMGYKNDSSVRTLLNEATDARSKAAMGVADFLKDQIEAKRMIDVGVGVERELGISREKLEEAIAILELEGYGYYGGRFDQVTNPGQKTTQKVLCAPGTEHSEIYDLANVKSVTDYISYDDGATFDPGFAYPESLNSSRLKIRYAEEGGIDKDGVIELRRGCKDLDLQGSNYAQVRIMVDGTHYLKGMAVYGADSDKWPPGVDVIFNTNKKLGTPALGEDKNNTVLKHIKKDDPNNPFGSLIKDAEHGGQYYYEDENGERKLGLLNKRADEGDWNEWSKTLPSQFLSKQPIDLIKKQLGLAEAEKQDEFEKLCALTNPTVKRNLLESFADDCDSTAVHLQAAGLPGTRYQVILPITSLKDTECYAPNYPDGETLALIRYPHGGTFEIPIVKNNTKNKEAIDILGKTPVDAIGINAHVAGRLSGADFDGDTVMCIPCNSSRTNVKILSTHALKELEGFDPKTEYAYSPGMKVLKKGQVQNEMGTISNLITDMTLKGAPESEIARAVKHSMVVIDAEKHKLDYKRSEKENGIAELKSRYQGHIGEDGQYHEGAATLISRAKSQTSIPKRQGQARIAEDGSLYWKTADDLYYEERRKVVARDPATGKKLKDANGKDIYETYIDPKTGKEKVKYESTGKIKMRTQKSTQMEDTKDARTLSSGTAQEEAYASYANKMKALANAARKEIMATGKLKYSATARAEYENEYNSLMAQLNTAMKNKPRERDAQRIANTEVALMKADNPLMTKAEIKKASQQALTRARLKVGAKRSPIEISDREWEAIQAGAVTDTQLSQILLFADTAEVQKRATPRQSATISTAEKNRIQRLQASGYTTAQIAEAVGRSASSVIKVLNE